MNGTAATAIAAFAVHDARRLLNLACVTGAFGIEVFAGLDDAFDEDLQGEAAPRTAAHRRHHPPALPRFEQRHQPEGIHSLIRQEETTGPVYETSLTVQDVYSIRCTPRFWRRWWRRSTRRPGARG